MEVLLTENEMFRWDMVEPTVNAPILNAVYPPLKLSERVYETNASFNIPKSHCIIYPHLVFNTTSVMQTLDNNLSSLSSLLYSDHRIHSLATFCFNTTALVFGLVPSLSNQQQMVT